MNGGEGQPAESTGCRRGRLGEHPDLESAPQTRGRAGPEGGGQWGGTTVVLLARATLKSENLTETTPDAALTRVLLAQRRG